MPADHRVRARWPHGRRPSKARPSSRPPSAHGVDIPHLCYKDGLRPDGNCRACVVEIEGERVLAPSCCRAVTPGMEVQASSERAREEPEDGGGDAAVRHAGQGLQVERCGRGVPARPARRTAATGPTSWASTCAPNSRPCAASSRPADISHPAMAVNLDACIQCNRCVRACREEQVNDVIGYALRGGRQRRSCSTSTTRWATAPAWPAANACRPAPPAR